jgi:acetolactate decarboxylase
VIVGVFFARPPPPPPPKKTKTPKIIRLAEQLITVRGEWKVEILKKISEFLLKIVVLSCLLLTACNDNATLSADDRETLFQASSNRALFDGNYAGIERIDALKKKGDFGIGVFGELDGEMILLDGVVYQTQNDGKILRPPESTTLTFSMVTSFEPDTTRELGSISNLDALKAAINPLIENKDAFYAIRIDGSFDYVKARSLPKQKQPYQSLTDILNHQPEFEFSELRGTVIGFWCPDYVGQLNAAGYHLHFISEDRTQGGHINDISISNAKLQLDKTWRFKSEPAK